MVEGNDSRLCQQHSAWDSPNLHHMNTLSLQGQQHTFPSSMNPLTFTANVPFPGFPVSVLPGLKAVQTNGVQGLFQHWPPRFGSSHIASNSYLRETHCAFADDVGVKASPNDVVGSVQKRFLIFDQSGSQTRLFFSPFTHCQNPVIASKAPVHAFDFHDEKRAVMIEQVSLTKPSIWEKSGENYSVGEGSEMHEDTEEIDALLYSDDDDDDDDEVTSTCYSAFAVKGSYGKHDQVDAITEEVASSDGSTKRQRLLDGGYKKTSLMDTAWSVELGRSSPYGVGAESGCAESRINGKDTNSILGNNRSRKDKIRATLRILQSIVPGVNSNDPLLVIDEAVNYLKSLKHKAKVLGIDYP